MSHFLISKEEPWCSICGRDESCISAGDYLPLEESSDPITLNEALDLSVEKDLIDLDQATKELEFIDIEDKTQVYLR